MIEELATALHNEMCGLPCGRGESAFRPGTAHNDYYLDRAKTIFDALEPMIGSANVLPTVRVILAELS
jgi:hypothetical protein